MNKPQRNLNRNSNIFIQENAPVAREKAFIQSRPQCVNPSIGSDNGLTPNRRQAIVRTNADLIHSRIYAALGGDELIYMVMIHEQ